VDIDQVLDRADMDKLMARVDINQVLDRVDMEKLMARVDINEIAGRIDIEALVANTDLGALMASSSSTLATRPSTADEVTRSAWTTPLHAG
jgi:hypothetical protein